MPKLEEALEGLNIKAADVLAWHEYPDRVVVVLISGPKLTWPPAVEPTGAPAPEVKASDEARQAAAELGVDLKDVEAHRESGKVSAKDVRLHKSKK
ncbi:MAG TPA: hypothetical protein VII92_11350 [Anaerolineae bacterium]